MDVQTQKELLDALYRHYAQPLRRMLVRRVGLDEAQDLVQDCYLRLLERTDVAQITHPQAFMYTVAGNLAVNHMAKASVRARYLVPATDAVDVAAEIPSLEASASALHTLEIVARALEKLPESCRLAFVLNRIEGLTYVQVAQRLKISEKSVERYVARALSACRAALMEATDGPNGGRLNDPT